MLSKVSPHLPVSLTNLEWKSDLEKWFDYNLDKHYSATTTQQIPSHARFELLHRSPEHATQIAATANDTVRDGDPVWMKNDFPKGPWDDDPDFDPDGILRWQKPDEGNWIWGDFPPSLNELDAQWSYVYDLDSDAFSVNSIVHFRLSNMPHRFVRYLGGDREENLVMPPKNLAEEHLAWDIFPEQPLIQQDLMQNYMSSQVTITNAPEIANHPAHLMLLDLQRDLRKRCAWYDEIGLNWQRWAPADRGMQRLVWLFVRYAMLDGLTWVVKKHFHSIFDRYDEYWDGLEEMPSTIPMPAAPQYYVYVGMNKILISLARCLDVEDMVKMEVAKVINLTPPGTVQNACIISLDHLIIVTADKSSSQVHVYHTLPLKFEVDNQSHSAGIEALIGTFSPLEWHSSRLVSEYDKVVLPPEIVDQIFQELFLAGDRMAITNFALVCKSFSQMVRDRTVKVGSCLMLTFPTARRGWFYGFDENAKLQLFGVSDVRNYKYVKDSKRLKILADGVNLGLSEKVLRVVEMPALLDSKDQRE